MIASGKVLMSLFYACFALLLFGGVGTAISLDKFYPFGTSDDQSLPRSDDGFSSPNHLDPPFNFFGSKQTKLFVNKNGILSFDKEFEKFTPRRFPLKGNVLIAPFWADVDTRGTGDVWYRSTSDESLLNRAKNEIIAAFVDHGEFEPKKLFIATWDRVGYYRNHTCRTNTFQSILVHDGSTSFTIFYYAKDMIQWTTGDASGGHCGLGGAPAQVGLNAGDGRRFISVPGSWTRQIINIANTSNVGIPGVWIFRVDEEKIKDPPNQDPPKPCMLPRKCGECRDDLSVSFTITPRKGSILGGTAIHLRGPCFTECDNITCMFEGKQNVTGTVWNNHTAICVSPTFRSAGHKSIILFIIRENEEKKLGECHFYSAYPQNISDVTIGEDDSPLLVNGSGEDVTVHWKPKSLLPLFDPKLFKVNIDLYELDFEKNEWKPFKNFKTLEVDNSGTANFLVPKSDKTENGVYPVAIRISVGSRSEGVKTSRFCTNILEFAKDKVIQWKTDLFYADATDLDFFHQCMAWQKQDNSLDIDNDTIYCCPETKEKVEAPNSGFVRDTRDELVSFLRPEAESCYIQKRMTSDNLTLGQQCCYNGSDEEYLITGPDSGGTVNLVTPVGLSDYHMYYKHLMEDIIPAIYCCKGKHTLATCSVYYDRREYKTNETCELPHPGYTVGDPHIVTMDNFMYTFNGLGEFVLIETVNDIFTLQGRMIQFWDKNRQPISTSAYSAIVARQIDSDTVQFQIVDKSNDTLALVNGELVDFEDLPEQQFNNVILKKSANAMSAVFSSGVHIEVKAAYEVIFSLLVSLPNNSYYRSQTSGLMGNYNGDKFDDLLPRGGTVPISDASSTEEIHKHFGMTWIVSKAEDSLFTYGKGEDWSTYYRPYFVPFYNPTISDPILQEKVNTNCSGYKCCEFDVAATGDIRIGIATREGMEYLENITKQVKCDPPCENGVCVKNNTCSCYKGFSGDRCDIEPTEKVCDEEENICKNGTCMVKGVSISCKCFEGYTGLTCQDSKIVSE